MYYHDRWNETHLLFGVLSFVFWAAVIAAVIWFAVAAFRRLDKHTPSTQPLTGRHETPRETLDRRFVNGELDESTYRAMRRALDGEPPA